MDCDLLPVGSITVRAAFMSPIRGCGHALAVVQVEEYRWLLKIASLME